MALPAARGMIGAQVETHARRWGPMITKDELQRRVLLAQYPRRSSAVLNATPDHNPLVLEDCPACRGSGRRCVEDGEVAVLSECTACGGDGTTYAVVSYFSNSAPAHTVDADADGWTTCTGCGRRFSLSDPHSWTGLRHVRCVGGRTDSRMNLRNQAYDMQKRGVGLLIAATLLVACRSKQAPPVLEESTSASAPRAAGSPPTSAMSNQPRSVRHSTARIAACPRMRAPGALSRPTATLNKKPTLLPFLLAGAKGSPELVRLRFHHPIAGCECPSFELSDYPDPEHREVYDETGLDAFVYVVFPDEIPNGHQYELGKFIGRTSYEMTGYFSGRVVDFYGWAITQNDADGEPIGGEGEDGRQAFQAEFCVVDWCFRPDPNPVKYKTVMSPAEIAAERKEYASLIAQMKRDGAKLCSGAQ